MKIFFATWTEINQGESLTKKKAFTRLLSYFFLKDEKYCLNHYAETGIFSTGVTNGNKNK
jgi:hypothetical protein